MKNAIVRQALKKYGMCQWELALILGVSEQTMYRKLRVELPEEEQHNLADLITKHRKEDV